mgnify:CR=1 FL=1
MLNAAGGALAAGPAAAEPRPRNVEEAAGAFEALLIGQLLKSARGGAGWLGAEDSASEPILELAEQQISLALAAHGGLGLARLVVEGLQRAGAGRGEARSQSVPK